MTEIYELGADINSNWDFKDGDLKLIENKENLSQSIVNRLNASYGTMEHFYDDYGSIVSQFLGWKKSEETLRFIRLEILDSLKQDPRLNDIEVEVEYNSIGKIRIEIIINISEDDDFSLSLTLTEEGGIEIAD